MKPEEISHLRKEYTLHSLSENDVAATPIEQFERWWKQASDSAIEEMNAMTLSTIDANGMPDARTILLKG